MGDAPALPRWDLYCRVVDNLGDIGIAWRLARQLVRDGLRAVRLHVDDLEAFARIEPGVDARRERQSIGAVDCVAWSAAEASMPSMPPAVVIEMLGCGLPTAVLDAMAASPATAPIWIDYEHLSAEPWVGDFHRMPSPRPDRPLVKHFFYPGFDRRTGGLLVEPDLEARRRAFVDDGAANAAFWQRLGVPSPVPGERRLSLFAYPDAPVAALLDALATDAGHWSVVIAGRGAAPSRSTGPTVWRVPFVDQDDYDRLLWACDANCVRGEDSFVRAQAAGRPFVWQIYRQPDRVHLGKLAAFEDRYEAVLPPDAAAAQRRFWDCWNGDGDGDDAVAAARAWLGHRPALEAGAALWRDRLDGEAPLVGRLTAFVASLQAATR